MRSTHLPRRLRLAAGTVVLIALSAVLLPASTGVSQTVEPPCPEYQAEPFPASFDGCAELQAQVEDVGSFMGPDGFRLDAYEAVLQDFFEKYCHRDADAGWERDKRLRDTGPYVATQNDDGTWSDPAYYGTHQPVVVWYNAPMMDWLRRNRPAEGAGPAPASVEPIPDGAIMVKEMYPAPAARCNRFEPEHLKAPPSTGFAFMVRDQENAQDGWFWGAWWEGFTPDWPAKDGNPLPAMGFGAYCLNCHASAADNQTFADLKNVEGEPGEPNVYLIQSFLFDNELGREPGRHRSAHDVSDDPERHDEPLPRYSPAFLARFQRSDRPTADSVRQMPSQTYDHVWIPGGGPTAASEFVTSTQCIGCHDAGSTGVQFDMTRPDPAAGALLNDSPYATWRTSPMGLGGRDPIFFAQLASETETFHPDQSELVQNVCLGCHGVQGQRQFGIDHGRPTPTSDDCPDFTRADVDAVPYPSNPLENPDFAMAPYGALARDGISCTACHHMALTTEEIERVRDEPQNRCVKDRQELLNPMNSGFARTFTGSYWVGAPDRLKGPFSEPKVKPMEHALGITPELSAAVQNSELCGTCHTVHLPIFDGEKTLGYTYEQTTYPEWAMSAYRTGVTSDDTVLPAGRGDLAQSCQACHMKSADPETGLFASKIASIQEVDNFPASENTLPAEEVDLPVRPGFARHTLVGLNVFFVEMAQQFPEVLGIRTQDPMLVSRGVDPVLVTEREMLRQATFDTATVEVRGLARDGESLTATVRIDNQVGHKFPSGVGFRRAFLEFEVLDAAGNALWASGRTDETGTIVDQRGRPVAGELWWQEDCSERLPGTPHQPHYQEITRQDQAQIYQELVTSPAPVDSPECGRRATPGGQLTTSFLSICGHEKDNRLLPHGFLPEDERVAIAKAFGAGDGVDLAEDTGPWNVDGDPDYETGGGDSLIYRVPLAELGGEPVYVRATLFYQTIPPFYLQDRFCTSKSADTDRLYYLAGHLGLDGRMKDWKLEVVGSGLVRVE